MIAEQVAIWLKKSMEEKNRTHLLGNHDLSYLDTNYKCSGFRLDKLVAIKMTGIDLSKLKLYTWIDDWLCTHAGLSYDFYEKYARSGQNVNDFLETYSFNSKHELRERLYDCSNYRGGIHEHSGILWCDYNEFKDIPDTKQIFGHTHGEIRHKINDDGSEHYCIDNFLQSYAIYNGNGKMVIKKIDE